MTDKKGWSQVQKKSDFVRVRREGGYLFKGGRL